MERSFLSPIRLRILSALLVSGLVFGCSSRPTVTSDKSNGPLSRVDFRKAPELQYMEQHARELTADMYPKIIALLLNNPSEAPSRFDLVIGPLESGNNGETRVGAKKILINSDYLIGATNALEQLDHVLIHELTHMAIEPRGGKAKSADKPSSDLWVWGESFADYARFNLLGSDGWNCAECGLAYPHYLSGYTCGGAFLLYVQAKFAPSTVRDLVTAYRRGDAIEARFQEIAGVPLDDAWSDFQTTHAFKPIAAKSWALQQRLGFKYGQPPRDFVERIKQVAEQGTNRPVAKLFSGIVADNSALYGDRRYWRETLALFLYLDQPGGSAEQFVTEQRAAGTLPGVRREDKGRLFSRLTPQIVLQDCPQIYTIDLQKQGNSLLYHYEVHRDSETSGWKLRKAWRTAEDGSQLEDLSVPD